MSADSVNRLLMIAMPQEAALLPALLGGEALRQFDGLRLTSRCGSLLIGVSGLGGHNMAAMASRLLADNPGITSVANFGSAGAYLDAGLQVGDCCMVSSVAKWDLHLPLAGSEAQFAPVDLDGGPPDAGLPRLACNSGCSFSGEADRRRPGFPRAGLEDMELYSLAVLCQLHGLPLWSMKFVTNIVSDNSLEDFSEGFTPNIRRASERMQELLGSWQA